ELELRSLWRAAAVLIIHRDAEPREHVSTRKFAGNFPIVQRRVDLGVRVQGLLIGERHIELRPHPRRVELPAAGKASRSSELNALVRLIARPAHEPRRL